ncbi:CocE/NonD family hydrolase [Streptomyces sp. NPDC059441]|uniref:CocE/NonD family hydrolase n=1 Tax=Streptomyces sp. NPDC059441 TaxID=3346829 RepID=UPI00369A3AB1
MSTNISHPSDSGSEFWRRAVPLDADGVRYPGFRPESIVLKAGTQYREGALPLPCDIAVDRDVAVPLRDGTTIYTDLYRPVDGSDLPTIVSWSPYGKRGGTLLFDDVPHRAGVPLSVVSGLEKFEGPDPAYWCAHGYAVANPDARGAFMSEGDTLMWNSREGQDGADFVDWVGEQEWSNGKVGLSGSSWLAVAQWFIAAERPRHLAAISPWEGLADVYRSVVAPGGIVDPGFAEWLIAAAVGNGNVEDLVARIEALPTADAWEDYIAKVENIDVPAYVIGSWANVLHSRGTFEAWRKLQTPERWLRVHDSLEWPDFYQPHNQDDLRRFFDRYLRGLDTGWESTPRVRVDVVDPGHTTVPNQSEDAFPPSRSHGWALHLDPERGALTQEQAGTGAASYDAVEGALEFTYTFDEDTELIGYPRLTLFLEAEGADDIDVFAKLSKIDADGEPLGVQLLPLTWAENAQVADEITELAVGPLRALYYYDGPWARLRVSHRAKDEARSELVPHHLHVAEERLKPGQVVEVELGFTAIGMRFHAGETLRLTVTGKNTAVWAGQGVDQPALRNRGLHIVHGGPETDSRLVLPLSRSSRRS